MLSMLDLIEDDTVTQEMAGYFLFAMRHGASVLTGARPGGAGKTALLGAVLNLLPPSERLVTVSDLRVLSSEPEKPACFLAHEIGSGSYYGYIWGGDITRFFEKAAQGYRAAATIHADDPDDLWGELEPFGVSEGAMSHVTVTAFIRADRSSSGIQRIVSSICECCAGERRTVFRAEGGGFNKEESSLLIDSKTSEEEYEVCCEFFSGLACRPEISRVRKEVLKFYGALPQDT